ncbi:hypothetical protein ARMGADRAFT_1021927 [Armillaria gallica]|uniref:Uncharacterized protein n=1 Tax=Armillaria gallica TaxID=47427 RepID=A0A2H3EIM3_ARMGA|nr:hypothetical protein ARMGADRAFT_1021927 [Armillaria gallica]
MWYSTPLLLALGVSPGSFIPNCSPNDCPNPFAELPPLLSGSNAMHPTGKEVIIESPPTVTDSQTWPDGWFTDARAYLGCFKLGPNWDCLIDVITMLEAKQNFVKAGKAFQHVDRPLPPNPETRHDEGDWEKMDRLGQNGLYSVVASLGWWGRSVQHSSSAREEWLLAMEDVCWAMECVATMSTSDNKVGNSRVQWIWIMGKRIY